ncbi:MAG: hypothetical protein KGJ80_02185 [Chloroflexota bacterium]|nr:hypothetical protein [Chloroflexota bacterium]
MTNAHDERYARAIQNAGTPAPAWQDGYDSARPHNSSARSNPLERSRRFWVGAFLLLSLLACVLGAVFIPGGLGFLAGYQELQGKNHEAAIQHFNRGLGFLAENYPELAYTEFEIAVKFDSGYEPAQQKLRELQARLAGSGTPGPQEENRVAATLLDEARGLVNQKQWSDAITRLEQLRSLNPDFLAAEVSDWLYQANVGGGKEAVAADQIELARERFDAALAIRNNDPEVVRQRDLALLYLDGQQAVGYNWQTAIQKFSALYQQDPNYDDVKKRLLDAYTRYGDLAAKQNAWCLAVREYDGALAVAKDAAVTDKRAQALAACKQAIASPPTPTTVPGSENYTWKSPYADNSRPCTGVGDVSGTVRDALDRPMAGVMVGYYADSIPLTTTRTNATGQYQLVGGKETALVHIVVLGADGKTPAGLVVDWQYPGGNNAGCHLVIDWTKVQ